MASFRPGTRTVPVYATVTDAGGRLVPHDLEVRITQPGLTARARKSYIAQ